MEEIFESNAWGDNNNHFSGRMVFDHDGYLFVAVGDRMVTPDMMWDHPAQDLTNHMGTIVRLHDDGRVPSDNPFVGRGGRPSRDLELRASEHAGARPASGNQDRSGRTNTVLEGAMS